MLLYTCYIRMAAFFLLFLPSLHSTEEHLATYSAAASQRSGHGEYKVSNLARTADVIVVGQIVQVANIDENRQHVVSPSAEREPEIRLVLVVRVEQVLKGDEPAGRASLLNVLVIPAPGDTKIDPAEWQAYKERLLKESSKRFIFFLKGLDPLEEGSEQQKLDRDGVLYHYLEKIEAASRAVDLVKVYLHLAEISDPGLREEALVEFAFSLLRDPKIPVRFAKDALEDLADLRGKSAEKLIGEGEIGGLVQVLTDPERSDIVRSWASVVLEGFIKAGRRIDSAPLLRMLEDSSDDIGQRVSVIYLLEQMNTPEIRAAVAVILAEEPQTEEDQIVWRALANSKLVK